MTSGSSKAAQYEQQGVDLADATEEPVAEPLPGRGPGDQPCDVDHLDPGSHDLAALAHLGERIETVVRKRRDPDGGLGGGERMVSYRRQTPGEGVEKRGLPGVREPDEPDPLHSHDATAGLGILFMGLRPGSVLVRVL